MDQDIVVQRLRGVSWQNSVMPRVGLGLVLGSVLVLVLGLGTVVGLGLVLVSGVVLVLGLGVV